jgi:hypothetical protein
MKDAALSEKQDIRITLISCMVLICFESFHGDQTSAAKQIGIGFSLVEDEMITANANLEEDLISSFAQLEIQALSFGRSRSKESHQKLAGLGQATIDSMPSEIRDFQQALYYFECVQSRLFHFMAAVSTVQSGGCLTLDNAIYIPVDDLPERDIYLQDMVRWRTACDIYPKEAQFGSENDIFRAASIQLLYFTTYVAAVMVRDSDHDYPETRKAMPMFRQMLVLAKTVLNHNGEDQKKSTFKIAMQIICPLYLVARRRPHRGLRREAIALLLLHPRREGLWNSMLAGKLGEWVMMLEEDNYEGDFIPEDMRCSGIMMLDCDMIVRRAHLVGKLPSKNGSDMIFKEEVITW